MRRHERCLTWNAEAERKQGTGTLLQAQLAAELGGGTEGMSTGAPNGGLLVPAAALQHQQEGQEGVEAA